MKRVLVLFVLLCCMGNGGVRINDEGLDLPVLPPEYKPPQPTAPYQHQLLPDAPLPVRDPQDDPPDEPLPIFYGEEIESENDTIYYILDMSGSMGWDSQSYIGLDGQTRTGPRIDRAKAELARSISGLSPNFRFGVLVYSCTVWGWGDGYVLRDATEENKQSALTWLEIHSPTGGTGTGPAVAAALRINREILSVVLLTDGEPNCGVNSFYPAIPQHREMVSNNNEQGATIDVFGIAAGDEQRQFCQAVAADSGGTYIDVP